MKYCHYRTFNSSNTEYLLKNLGKLQRLVRISKEYGIELQSKQGSKSHSVKKMVVFTTTTVDCKIIEWINVNSISKSIKYLLDKASRLSITRLILGWPVFTIFSAITKLAVTYITMIAL